MTIVLFDPPDVRLDLLPLTFTRPVAEIRCGILTISEKWASRTGLKVSHLTVPHLSEKYPFVPGPDRVFIDGSILPDAIFIEQVKSLQQGHALRLDGSVAAIRTEVAEMHQWDEAPGRDLEQVDRLTGLCDVFRKNGDQIRSDFSLITAGRKSEPLSDPNTKTYHPESIFLEPGAQVFASVINATDGPVYLGRNSIIREGSLIRGPFALGDDTQLAMGTVIRGDTTIGPGCRAGGEINNAVMFSNSNKSHYGYLGNAVIGSWCNLGAGTTASNLTNSFDEARLWNYRQSRFVPTGSPFCGLIMGDFTTTAVGTLFNTATSVGPGSKIFGAGFARTYLPPFTRGGSAGLGTMDAEEIIGFAERIMARRGIEITATDKNLLRGVHAQLADLRKLPARNH